MTEQVERALARVAVMLEHAQVSLKPAEWDAFVTGLRSLIRDRAPELSRQVADTVRIKRPRWPPGENR